jgi:hypothetical protein
MFQPPRVIIIFVDKNFNTLSETLNELLFTPTLLIVTNTV